MPNRLVNEQSPYLLQHAHNPVDWYPWGDEAFNKAKAEHKPVIVSIGYAACHWCHVMERESFEDKATAEFMNQHFVCIKVDREEHPDVDHMYMDAVQAISGAGGWPLNVFVTPDRVPFYGGTYYPPRQAYNRPSWLQLMQRMTEVWNEQYDEVTAQADQMMRHLQQASQQMVSGGGTPADKDTCRNIADTLLKQADREKGGFGNAPKFPGTMAISYLLEHYHFTKYEPALAHALRSLDAMIEGGIYDQLGGGFARYATDRNWLIPHFEKMLYDNALLVIALCDAYSITKNEEYKRIVQETIAFAERELKDESGGYYCALDADSEGEEGKFYTWTWEEWTDALGGNEAALADYFGVSKEGNWEGTNILHVAKSIAEVAGIHGLSPDELKSKIDNVKQQLFAVRANRVRPITDDKCLLSWNALMNLASSKAGAVLGKDGSKYIALAEKHMEWMLAQFEKNGELMHTWKRGAARIPGKLDDYAYLIHAMLQLASVTGDNQQIVKAVALSERVIRDFSHDDGFFYYSSVHQTDIPIRKVDVYDGATPSANAVMSYNLWACGMCTENGSWMARSQQMIHRMNDMALRYSYSFGFWARLIQHSVMGLKTVICMGTDAPECRSELLQLCLPQAYVLTSQKEISELPIFINKVINSGLLIFVCTDKACLSPVNSLSEALSLV